MRTRLSKQQLETYREQGFLQISGFLSPAELEVMRAKAERHVARGGPVKKVTSQVVDNSFDAEQEGPRVLDVFYHFYRFDDETHAVARQIGDVFAQLLGDGRRSRIWSDRVFRKLPRASATPWHQDATFWPLDTNKTATMWIALQDTSAKLGALRFMPRSHRVTTRRLKEGFNELGEIVEVYPQLRGVEPYTAELAAGDCTIHNGVVLHASHPNDSEEIRLSYGCSTMPEDARLHAWEDIDMETVKHPKEHFDVWPSEEHYPII